MPSREEIFQSIKDQPEVGVLILGAGVNGTGLFRELAFQGVDCLLADKSDFVSGASSKSSRMIHGGLRYLENREFRLVLESLAERNRLLENAAHTVAPLKTTMPLFSWLEGLLKSPLIFLGFPLKPGGRGGIIVKVGLWFYDFVSRKNRKTPKHYFTSREKALGNIPGIHPDIVGAATYWDAYITQAERLCLELIQDGRRENPRCLALNYLTLAGLEKGAVILKDQATGEAVSVKPKVLVNATGAWVDFTNAALGMRTKLIGGTKGSHLVVDSKELRESLGDQMVYYERRQDGRICVVFPFQGKVIMGSTDIPIDDPETVSCDEDEIDYMLSTLRGVFPHLQIRREEIVYTYCGVRPLPAVGGDIPGKISRAHKIQFFPPEEQRPFPLFCLIGGKWTTFRCLAEEAADRILPLLGAARKCGTGSTPIGGGREFPNSPEERDRWIQRVAGSSRLSRERISVLLERYGTLAEEYAGSLQGKTEAPLRSHPGYTVEEIRHMAAAEYVEHLTDLICRRTLIAFLGEARREVLEELVEIVGDQLNWERSRREDELRQALEEVAV